MNKIYQGEILKRIMNQAELKEFHEKYKSGLKANYSYNISKQDLQMAKEWKEGATVSELHQKYKLSHFKIDSRLRSVAKHHFLNS